MKSLPCLAALALVLSLVFVPQAATAQDAPQFIGEGDLGRYGGEDRGPSLDPASAQGLVGPEGSRVVADIRANGDDAAGEVVDHGTYEEDGPIEERCDGTEISTKHVTGIGKGSRSSEAKSGAVAQPSAPP